MNVYVCNNYAYTEHAEQTTGNEDRKSKKYDVKISIPRLNPS